jgi:hypothetical protein
LARFLDATNARAKEDTEGAKLLLGALASIAGSWNTEHMEAEQDRAAVEGQLADLIENVKKRSSLAPAQSALEELVMLIRTRAAKTDERASRRDDLNAQIGALVLAYQDRQKAIENEAGALNSEASKWAAYYAARVARAQTECAITGAAPPAPTKKK